MNDVPLPLPAALTELLPGIFNQLVGVSCVIVATACMHVCVCACACACACVCTCMCTCMCVCMCVRECVQLA